MSNEVTGQFVIRDTNKSLPSHPGKRIVMVVGVLAIDDDAPFVGEHQYPVSGRIIDGIADLFVHAKLGCPLSKKVKNCTADQLLATSIWRV